MLEYLSSLLAIYIVYSLYDWWSRRSWVEGYDRKCVLVTGCDSGFGNRTAKRLCDRGVHVFAGCYTVDGGQKLREETGGRVDTILLDVSKTESINSAYTYINANLPPNTEFWGVVNNAGVPGPGGPLEFITRDDLRYVMEVNFFGPLELIQIFLPLLKKSKGRVVNTASMITDATLPGIFPYLASKTAMRSCSEALRYEKSVWGIHVATVLPGTYSTNMVNPRAVEETYRRQWNSLKPEVKEEYGQEYIDARIEGICNSLKHAPTNIEPVVDAYEHALLSKKPYGLYRTGIDATFVNILRNYCPSFLLPTLISKFFVGATPAALKNS